MTVSRRRFLSLVSAACLAAPSAQAFRWQGTALGAQAQIVLDHPDAPAITARALAEIDRLGDMQQGHTAIGRFGAAAGVVHGDLAGC